AMLQGSRTLKAAIATFGLVACSGILVHMSGGTIEAHFHFFIVLALVSLYQEWSSFLLAIVFVVLHHGIVGTLSPESVYNHPSAIAHPWTWAALHAILVLGESIALVAAWRLSEEAHQRASESASRVVEGERERLLDQERAREAIERREAQLEEAQQIARVGSWEWNLDTNVVETSRELRQIFGIESDSEDGFLETFMDRIHLDDRSHFERVVQTAIDTGDPYTVEYRIAYPPGSIKYVYSSGKVVKGDDGRSVCLTGTAQDITERKLLETQLLQSSKMEAVGQLAGGIAHDFNNLLSVVSSYGRFVAETLEEGTEARDDIAQVLKAGERGAELTRRLLTFSRKQIVQAKIVDLNELIVTAQELLSRTIPENVHFGTKLAEDLWLTSIDPVELEQILINLTVNAKDAMPDGGSLVIETDNVHI
ncbi:MAG: PAS domain-containing protein, partial [Actinobacteria bacterium]|nr:PAS domain-containing protein [Actinomycetota bacterium]